MDERDQPHFEMLDDPDEPGSRGSAWSTRLDLLLGLVILLAVAGLAGWQWWSEQSRAASYQAGLKYAQDHRWEDARSAYRDAGGYRDSPQRLADVERTIAQRDTAYANALIEAGRGEWATALRDLRSVLDIQPRFRDSLERSSAAEEQVYSLALSGTVALRPSAWPPGLYWHTGTEWIWTWLVGSDEDSAVRGTGSACCVVYDVPAAAITGAQPPSAAVEGDRVVMRNASERALMLARKTPDGIIFKPLNAGLSTSDTISWDESGTFTFSNKRETERIAGTPLERVSVLYPGLRLSYQPHDSNRSLPLEMPGPLWALLALMPGDGRVVLGDYTHAEGDTPQTSLYLSSPSGERVSVAVRPGIVQAVFPSPDGRYLLLDEFNLLPGGEEEHRLVVLSLKESAEPVIAAQTRTPQPTYFDTNWYFVSYVRSGVYAGKALVRGNPGRSGENELILIDPARPRQALWTGRLAPSTSTFVPIPLEAGLLISLTDWVGQDLGVIYLDAQLHSSSIRLVTRPWDTLDGVWQRGDYLVYALSGSRGYGGGVIYSVRSLKISQLAERPARPVVLYEDGYRGDLQPAGSNPRYWALGPGMLATVEGDGSLHAGTYDGSVDLPLEGEVKAFFMPHDR